MIMSDPFDWFKKQADPILEISEQVRTIQPDIVNEFGAWSLIKLVALVYFVNIYTPIISSKKGKWVDNMIYIELLAGSGLCQIKETFDNIAGSPVLVSALAKRPFDKTILVEMNSDFCSALDQRLAKFGSNYKIIEKDCNLAIDEILEEVSPNDHYLAFIDCQSGFEMQWSTLIKLLSRPGDLIFNFQSVSVHRTVCQYQDNPSIEPRSLMNLYGDDRWKEYQTREECLKGYIDKIRTETNREVVIPLYVRGPKSYHYDLIVATRKTGANNPWMDPMREVQIRFKKLEPKIVETIIDVIKGRKKTLSDFF